jgi:hypothetical protein
MSMRLLICLFPFLPAIAYAEVLDKEFSFSTVLLWTALGVLVVFFSARFKPVVLAAAMPVLVGFFALHLPELLDPQVGNAIRSEAGPLYILLSWVGPALICGALIMGLILRSRHAKSEI